MHDDAFLEWDIIDCPACDGEGVVYDIHFNIGICFECNGTGLIVHRKRNPFLNNNHLKNKNK